MWLAVRTYMAVGGMEMEKWDGGWLGWVVGLDGWVVGRSGKGARPEKETMTETLSEIATGREQRKRDKHLTLAILTLIVDPISAATQIKNKANRMICAQSRR